jgi:hypothetical protein
MTNMNATHCNPDVDGKTVEFPVMSGTIMATM